MKFAMSPGEIIKCYKEAKDKNKQIEILADLNAVKKQDIIDVLKEEGVLSDVPNTAQKDARKKRLIWTDEMVAKLRQHYHEGLTQSEIAKRLGVDKAAVNNKLNRSGIRKKVRPEIQQTSSASDEQVKNAQAELREVKHNQHSINPNMLIDSITYATEVLNLLDVLKAVNIEGLTDIDSVITVAETAYNITESLYACLSDLHLELLKGA